MACHISIAVKCMWKCWLCKWKELCLFSSWRWLYYTFAFSYGVFCLWDKPWLWDINNCWYDYPHQVCYFCPYV